MNSTQLKYKGSVKIKVGRKTYSNYNAGDNNLFSLIFRCLNNPGDVKAIDTPTYIDLLSIDSDQNEQSALYRKASILKECISIGTVPALRVTTSLTDTNLRSFESKDGTLYELVLYDGDSPSKRLASIGIGADIVTRIHSGRQAIIEWTLTLSNEE